MNNIQKNKEKKIEEIGAKAFNLNVLEKNGINVPKWFCILESKNKKEAKQINIAVQKYVEENFKNIEEFSVRSSTNLEDSANISFAGQFITVLFVKKKNILEEVEKVRNKSEKKDLNNYIKNISIKKDTKNPQRINKIETCVIVQEMVNASKSGVMFTKNPNGLLNELVIVCGAGIGENIVEDKVPTVTYYYNKTDKIGYFEKQKDSVELSEKEKNNLIEVSEKIEKIYDKPMDIEWCIKDNNIYILQARPITTFSNSPNNIVLDNSNIVESYPGITLPLTIDFVKEMYYKIFKNLIIRGTNNDKLIVNYEEIFKNMVDSNNGKMYYRISNWYFLLSFLPYKDKIIKIWQEMLGVNQKKVTIDNDKKVGVKIKLKIVKNSIKLFKENDINMQNLEMDFNKIKNSYEQKMKKKEKNNTKLILLYNELISKTMENWDYTLINDLNSFIYTSLVKKEIKNKNKKQKGDKEILDGEITKYISKINNLESMKPIKEMVNIAQIIKKEKLLEKMKAIDTIKDYNDYINLMKSKSKVAIMIENYIETYGDRSQEELKLETITFRINPVLLIKKLIQFAEDENLDNIINEEKSLINIKEDKKIIKYKEKAMQAIMHREKSRFNRCRIYAMVRNIFLEIGKNLKNEGKILEARDIFYLNLNDVLNLKDSNNKNFIKKVECQKNMFDINKKLPQYSRLIFDKEIIEKVPTNINEIETKFNDKVLRGIPSSSGIITGEVVLIEDITKNYDISGKILVTKLTDPGWVFLIAQATGIIAEKGSILSHTAIISRELKKPAVVGVDNVMKILKNGDIVELNGKSGIITIKNRKN